MSNPEPQSRAQPILATLAFFVFALVFSYHFAFLRSYETFTYAAAAPEALAQGLAPTPYQYRILVPALVGTLNRLTATDIPSLYRIIEFIATVALCYAFRAFINLFAKDQRLASLFTIPLCYVLPYNFTYTFLYPWDIPTVLFTTLGLIALYRKDWRLYYAIFILGTFNRETTYFLTLVYIASALGIRSWRNILTHTGAQAGIWFVIKATLYFAFRANPVQGAGLFEFQFFRSLAQLAQPGVLSILIRNWGMIWIFVLLWLARIKDSFLRRALLVCGVQLVILFFVGVIEEMRIYGEIIPILLAGLFDIVKGFFEEKNEQQGS